MATHDQSARMIAFKKKASPKVSTAANVYGLPQKYGLNEELGPSPSVGDVRVEVKLHALRSQRYPYNSS